MNPMRENQQTEPLEPMNNNPSGKSRLKRGDNAGMRFPKPDAGDFLVKKSASRSYTQSMLFVLGKDVPSGQRDKEAMRPRLAQQSLQRHPAETACRDDRGKTCSGSCTPMRIVSALH
jgi:hypothetical protein